MVGPTNSDNQNTITVRVPISIRKRGGRKLILTPDGTRVAAAPSGSHVDNAMVKVIARAFRWRDMLETGQYATIREIAVAEKINESYVGRVLRLTLLAPDIIEAITSSRQSPELRLDTLLTQFPLDWQAQQLSYALAASTLLPNDATLMNRNR